MIGPYTEVDSEVQEALDGELERQRTTIELIASENFTSPAVLAAQGSVLTNKYAEGYPGKRYYGGCEQVDKVENLAIERPRMILAGASAYPRIFDFERFREISDEVGAFFLTDMAHIAGLIAAGVHPSPIPYSEILTTTTHKTLRGARGGMILCREEFAKKVNSRVFPGMQGGPLMHAIAGKAVALGEALQPEFEQYARKIVANCRVLAEGLLEGSLDLVSGGTDNHLILVDLKDAGITGKQLEDSLEAVGITCNKNMVPNDPEPPTVTSGIRLGTAAMTTRGMGEDEMQEITEIIVATSHGKTSGLRDRVKALTEAYPLYE